MSPAANKNEQATAAVRVAAGMSNELLDELALRVLTHPTLADAIARRVVELMGEKTWDRPDTDGAAPTRGARPEPGYRAPDIATTAEFCRELGVSRTYAYAHREELGALTLGDGPKARLRWDMTVARSYMAGRSLAPRPEKAKPRRASRRRTAVSSKLTAAGNEQLVVPDFAL